MMPFTAEYLREMDAGSEKGIGGADRSDRSEPASRVASSANLLNASPPPVSSVTMHSYDISSGLSLVALSDHSGTIFISGFAVVQVLKGSIAINGYKMDEHSRTRSVHCPVWQPALPLTYEQQNDNFVRTRAESGVSKNKHPTALASFLMREANVVLCNDRSTHPGGSRPSYKADLFSEFPVILAIRGIPVGGQEWLVEAEDQSAYTRAASNSTVRRNNIIVQTAPNMIFEQTDVVKVGSAMIGNYIGVTQNRVDCTTLPASWHTAAEKVCSAYRRAGEHNIKAVLCGAKGVGKSTCLRYTANRLLSATESYFEPAAIVRESNTVQRQGGTELSKYASVPAICVLDCDLGQPELSVPGSVSMHIVTSNGAGPFLSAPHLNLHTPDTSYFLGDVTSKNEPALVLQYVQRLLARYEEIVKEARAWQEQQQRAATKKFVGKNSFNALALEESSDSDGDDHHQKQSEKGSAGRALPPLIPLLVNLDGYVKNMGAEVVEGIVSLVQPTHALHICGDRDRGLIPLEAILGLDMSPAIGDMTPIGGGNNGSAVPNTVALPAADILHLEPGRVNTAPRMAAVDLRALRLVSYFLRSDESLSEYTARSDPALKRVASRENAAQVSGAGTSSGLSRSTSAEKLAVPATAATTSLAAFNAEAVQIRNGAIVDPLGAVAVALVSQTPIIIPFERIVWATLPLCGDLPPRLLLAALNASLVGILVLPEVHSDELPSASRSRKRLRHPTEGEFEITYATDVPTAPCVGMGIVRAVDMKNQRLILTSPVAEELLTRPDTVLCLVKGNNLQLPTAMVYSPLLPVFPYMSSESTGEGSAQLRTRNNVKRRGQQV
jgi:polynucleotide 5'-kinase involved in rRNA processing